MASLFCLSLSLCFYVYLSHCLSLVEGAFSRLEVLGPTPSTKCSLSLSLCPSLPCVYMCILQIHTYMHTLTHIHIFICLHFCFQSILCILSKFVRFFCYSVSYYNLARSPFSPSKCIKRKVPFHHVPPFPLQR